MSPGRPFLASVYDSYTIYPDKGAYDKIKFRHFYLSHHIYDPISDYVIDAAMEDLRIVTGQQPRLNRARKSIANFKLREDMPIGAHVTLRGVRMWEFFDRLVTLAIPRIRDFRGLNPKGFDGRGNYSFGVTEQLIFPEIDYDKVVKVRGMDITFVTTAVNDEQGQALLSEFGFPFRQQAGV